jgi:hypothetical protein
MSAVFSLVMIAGAFALSQVKGPESRESLNPCVLLVDQG